MRVSLTLREAEALAGEYYSGLSSPLTVQKRGYHPLDCGWWREPRKAERFNSDLRGGTPGRGERTRRRTRRDRGALNLYLALARSCLAPLPEHSFPCMFVFADGKRRNPDKGFVKMCLNAEPPILTCHVVQGHLLFVVTEEGREILETL